MKFMVITGLVFTAALLLLNAFQNDQVHAFENKQVGTTYYGGHWDEKLQRWVVDNANQCNRIKSGEISLATLDALMDSNCDDDNGLGYINSIPLHNQVSFAELSSDYKHPDWAALGGLPAGTKLRIQYGSRCVIAEKRDVGQGGTSVYGHHRSLDLWWQTARSLNFKNGFDVMTISSVPDSTPLTGLGQYLDCASGQPPDQMANSGSQSATTSTQSKTAAKPVTEQPKHAKTKKSDQPGSPGVASSSSSNGQVLGTSTPAFISYHLFDNPAADIAFILSSLAVLGGIPLLLLSRHSL